MAGFWYKISSFKLSEAILNQGKKADPRLPEKANKNLAGEGAKVGKASGAKTRDDARQQVDKSLRLEADVAREARTDLSAGTGHVDALTAARTLISARGRAPSFTGTDGSPLPAPGIQHPGIAPIGQSPGLNKHLVTGDPRNLEIAMGQSGYAPSQQKVYALTINKYVQQMLKNRFDWSSPDYNGGKILAIGPDNVIIHGHHRMVAAEIVRRLTGRDIFEGPNPIVSEGRWVRMDTIKRASRPMGWRGIGVEGPPPVTGPTGGTATAPGPG